MVFRYFLGLLLSRVGFVLFIISHQILLNTLASLGVCGRACDWFQSYLSEREQIVCVNDAKFDPVPLNCGVPQGSVGGPTFFSIYYLTASKHPLLLLCWWFPATCVITSGPGKGGPCCTSDRGFHGRCQKVDELELYEDTIDHNYRKNKVSTNVFPQSEKNWFQSTWLRCKNFIYLIHILDL